MKMISDKVNGAGTSKSFGLAVNMGLYPGFSTLDKFGENPQINTNSDPEDVWDYGGLYTFSTTADIVSLVSDDITDTQPIKVEGLDMDGNLVVQTLTLTGQTIVPLDTPLWRVHRLENEGTTNITGTVCVFSGTEATAGVPDGASVVKATIVNGNNQTLMAIYTIPKGKVGFLCRGELGMSRTQATGSCRASYYSRRFGKVFKVKKRIALNGSGTSTYVDERSFPDVIPALTDIKLTVEEVSANNTGVFGTFDILLIDETCFHRNYLTAIGQPQ